MALSGVFFTVILSIVKFLVVHNRGFPKIDHSGIDTRIVFKKNKFSKKVTSNRVRTLDPRTVVLTSCVQSHALPTELSGQVLIEGSLARFLFVHKLTFGLRGAERI